MTTEFAPDMHPHDVDELQLWIRHASNLVYTPEYNRCSRSYTGPFFSPSVGDPPIHAPALADVASSIHSRCLQFAIRNRLVLLHACLTKLARYVSIHGSGAPYLEAQTSFAESVGFSLSLRHGAPRNRDPNAGSNQVNLMLEIQLSAASNWLPSPSLTLTVPAAPSRTYYSRPPRRPTCRGLVLYDQGQRVSKEDHWTLAMWFGCLLSSLNMCLWFSYCSFHRRWSDASLE